MADPTKQTCSRPLLVALGVYRRCVRWAGHAGECRPTSSALQGGAQ